MGQDARLLQKSKATIAGYFYNGETAAEPTSATVQVLREDGTELVASTAATLGAAGDGKVTYDLTTTHTTTLDRLLAKWTNNEGEVVQTYHEVVGGHYFELKTLRDADGLEDTAVFTTDHLADARWIAEQFIEDFTEVAWVPRYARETFDGDGSRVLWVNRLPLRALQEVRVGGAVQTLTDWTASPSGRVVTDGDVFDTDDEGRNVVVKYEYGADVPPPDLVRAALRLGRHVALTQETAIPDRANLMTTEFATFRLNVADERHPTGLPEVDAVLVRYRQVSPPW